MYSVGVLCSMDSRYEWKAFWPPSGLDDSRAGPIMTHYDGTHGWHFGYSMGPAPIIPSRREFELFWGNHPGMANTHFGLGPIGSVTYGRHFGLPHHGWHSGLHWRTLVLGGCLFCCFVRFLPYRAFWPTISSILRVGTEIVPGCMDGILVSITRCLPGRAGEFRGSGYFEFTSTS